MILDSLVISEAIRRASIPYHEGWTPSSWLANSSRNEDQESTAIPTPYANRVEANRRPKHNTHGKRTRGALQAGPVTCDGAFCACQRSLTAGGSMRLHAYKKACLPMPTSRICLCTTGF